MVEREGFEPSIVLPLYTLSKRADSKQSVRLTQHYHIFNNILCCLLSELILIIFLFIGEFNHEISLITIPSSIPCCL